MSRRTAGDIGSVLRAEDMGQVTKFVEGTPSASGGKLSVRALAKAWDAMGKYVPPEADTVVNPHALPKGGAGSAEDDGGLELDLDEGDLAVDGDAPPNQEAAADGDDIDLDADDLDLGGDDEPMAAGDDDLDIEGDDLDLDDGEEPGLKVETATLAAGDLGDEDDGLLLDDEPPAADLGAAQPTGSGSATASASGPAAAATSTAPPASATSQAKRPDGSSITMITVPSHVLPNNRFLHEPFKVVKVDENSLLGGKKERIWDLDCFMKKFSNLDMAGYKSFSQKSPNLFRVEKHLSDPRRLILYFFEADHPYDLVLTSVERRNRFFEVATMMRRNSIMWCPSLCPETDEEALVNVIGTTIKRPSGKTAVVSGEVKFHVARMPYEIIDFWYGCFNMQQRPLPANHAILNGFMPPGNHDIYVVGVADVAGTLMGRPDLGIFFQSFLGPTYHVLTQTTVEAKDKPTKGNNAVIVICRRSFIVRMSNIEAAELDTVRREGTAKGDYSAVACSFRVNETTVGCVMLNATPMQTDAPTRSANLRAAIANLNVGNEGLDFGARFDYTFVGAAFGYTGPFSPADQLIEQRTAGNFLSEFEEAQPDASLAARAAGNPFRIVYHARHNICRFDGRSYASSTHMNFNNTSISGDLYTRRAFLSTFGEHVPRVQFRITNFSFVPKRVPPFQGGELRLTGEWIDGSPLVSPLIRNGAAYALQTPTSTTPPLKPVVHNNEFLRLQQLEISVFGVLANAKNAKAKINIASGAFSMKNQYAMNEARDFTTSMLYRGCIVGHVTGTLTMLGDEN